MGRPRSRRRRNRRQAWFVGQWTVAVARCARRTTLHERTPVTDGPLIVQSDKTLLLEVDHPDAPAARANIAPFAELERSPEHVHTYRITPLALWNARAAGHDAEQVVDALVRWSRFPVPQALLVDVVDTMGRYGRLVLQTHPAHGLIMVSRDRAVLEEVLRTQEDQPDARGADRSGHGHRAPVGARSAQAGAAQGRLAGRGRGRLRRRRGPPDRAERRTTGSCAPTSRRRSRGSGPAARAWSCCPAAPARRWSARPRWPRRGATTLILVTNTVAGRQWRRELLARTSLTEDEIGEYSGERKEIRPVTIATYQVMTRKTGGVYRHLELFDSRDWGLVIYDEVHLLPAPVFRMTADLQSRRRLGLTATLVREDGREGDVFSLIGPKRYDAPWRDIEQQGWIAPAECTEVRVTLTDARAAVLRHRRAGGALPDRLDRAHQAAGGQGGAGPAPRRADAGHRRLPRPAGRTRRSAAGPGHPGLDARPPSGSGCSTRFRAGEMSILVRLEGGELLHRPARRPPSRSRSPARSAPGRRRRSGWAGCCGRRRTAGRRTSTRWSPATPSTPTTRRIGSGSWPSRATPTASSTPTTCSDRPYLARLNDPSTAAHGGGRPRGVRRDARRMYERGS